jgi:hypothetical protein
MSQPASPFRQSNCADEPLDGGLCWSGVCRSAEWYYRLQTTLSNSNSSREHWSTFWILFQGCLRALTPLSLYTFNSPHRTQSDWTYPTWCLNCLSLCSRKERNQFSWSSDGLRCAFYPSRNYQWSFRGQSSFSSQLSAFYCQCTAPSSELTRFSLSRSSRPFRRRQLLPWEELFRWSGFSF